ncbi:hypothetical protein [Streptomyces sp. NK15101]|uniref:hypothetical protein n=1 Tax=Streptomyces sp. NK15101 TaxID=2873261 RepID=UPI001CEDB374|nr:hypothetical protein [Streptomyces sp. NK15101]
MFLHRLPPPSAVEPEPRVPWTGEQEALAQAAAAGLRAAAWIRNLPLPPSETWIVGPLADAVEDAMTTLDPGDETWVEGTGRGGLSEATEETLNGLIYVMPEVSAWLTPEQQLALLGIAHCVSGIPKLLATDPGTVIEGGGLAALCTVLDVACRTARASVL